MRFFTPIVLTVAFSLASTSSGLNILMNNDDGFASANLRELYRVLKAIGHNVWITAPVDNESGEGGRSAFTTSANLTIPSEFGIVPAGAPSVGHDPIDSQVWYYNGTPAACTFVGLDYVLPKYANFSRPDLLVSGPNFGTNLGPFLYTLSGTVGATYAAVERGIPAIAFSASNGVQTPYFNITNTTNPSTYAAEVAAKIVQSLIDNTPAGQRILPLGYGVSVNIPTLNDTYFDPPIVKTRLTGSADVDIAVYNASTGLFNYGDASPAGLNTCINGDCSLPGETAVVEAGSVSVSVFTVDYDAPKGNLTTGVFQKLNDIASNSTVSTKERRRVSSYSHP